MDSNQIDQLDPIRTCDQNSQINSNRFWKWLQNDQKLNGGSKNRKRKSFPVDISRLMPTFVSWQDERRARYPRPVTSRHNKYLKKIQKRKKTKQTRSLLLHGIDPCCLQSPCLKCTVILGYIVHRFAKCTGHETGAGDESIHHSSINKNQLNYMTAFGCGRQPINVPLPIETYSESMAEPEYKRRRNVKVSISSTCLT